MQKLEWNYINKDQYACHYKNEYVGLMYRKSDNLWYMILPKYNIIKEGEYRYKLKEYAETQFDKLKV